MDALEQEGAWLQSACFERDMQLWNYHTPVPTSFVPSTHSLCIICALNVCAGAAGGGQPR